MKRIVMMAIALSGAGFAVHAQTGAKADSLKVVNLQEVQVVSTRATAKTPVAFTNVRKEQISKQNFGQDIPFLLSTTPSVLTTSDAGAGVGYTTIRVRGTDATRINVTANGIPMNDAESHAIFWVFNGEQAHRPTVREHSAPVSICVRKAFHPNHTPKFPVLTVHSTRTKKRSKSGPG